MKTASRKFVRCVLLAAACLVMVLPSGFAQASSGTSDSDNARQVLMTKARALDARGRPDMAIQLWQQILMSDPNNTEALAGLARDYKLSGSAKQSDETLDKLRAVNPNDPNIAKIEALSSTRAQSEQLRRAGDLARQGRNDEAMQVYRKLFGDHPPDGVIALAYYQTLYGATGGKEPAIAGLRALAAKNPTDPSYSIELGKVLTYDPRTRPEGVRILQQYPQDPNARGALRQALMWDSANPETAGELRQYLKEHPQDTEIASRLKTDEAKLAQMHSGIARSPEERLAFAALNAKRLDDAQARFMGILQKDPSNPRAAAGMGYLRMQQQNFGGAVSYLTQAEQNGLKTRAVEDALATSRFWFTMSEASQALDANQLDVATDKYHEALAMRPRSPEALNGLAGTLIKAQQNQQAAGVYAELLKIQPQSADAWRGLFLSYARDGKNEQALDLARRFPPRVKAELEKDPEYLRTLATVYKAEGRSADAQRVLAEALSLPFPDNGMTLKENTRLQYAGILMEANRFNQAAELYRQILTDDPSNLSAWMGLVSAHHQMGHDSEAIADVERIPPSTYESALSDPGFLDMLGSIYQGADRLEIAQSLLERAVKLQVAAGGQPTVPLQLQLAGIYLQRGDSAKAYPIYRQVLTAHPERKDAWKGLIATLQATNHTSEALQEIAYIPPDVRKQLENDSQFVETEASIYAAAGDTSNALYYMARVERFYAQRRQQMPASLVIQNAWLLYNTQDDRALYATLMQLGSRTDLTAAQRETVQTIWANWAVRRAGAAIDHNENQRAVEILEAAAQAFPDNLQVKWILAGGYLRTGQAREALALYKKLPIQDATPDEYQGAIGSALAANDRTQAETWLRQALGRFPRNYRILGMAARYDQARGDNERAADYWRAALAAMPPNSPTDRLAHDLDYPDEDTRARKTMNAADLQRLLDPDYVSSTEQLPKRMKSLPLPEYGPDPYEGSAPVVTAPESPTVPAPPATQTPVPQAETTPHKTGPAFTGQVQLPASEESITSVAPPSAQSLPAQSTPSQSQQPVWIPAPPNETAAPQPKQANPQAASAPTDPRVHPALQLTPESAGDNTGAQIKPLENVPVMGPGARTQPEVASVEPILNGTVRMDEAQYTPSAQEAATGAYSAQKLKPQSKAPSTKQQAAPPPTGKKHRRKANPSQSNPVQSNPAQSNPATGPVPTLGTAPGEQNPASPPVQEPQQPMTQPGAQPIPQPETQPSPQSSPQPGTQPEGQAPVENPGGLTDEQLEQRNLPPLRGHWGRAQREPRPISPREEAEQQLSELESSYSGWLGGTALVNYRSGMLGYDRLAALEAPFEASAPLGYHARFTLVVKPVFLDSGQADGTSVITVQEYTSTGRKLVSIPQPLGTDINTGPSATTSAASTPPAQQNASGVGGELQLITPTFAIAGGYTPYGFLVSNWTARVYLRPANGPVTFNFTRDSIRDSQLSYSGLSDPGTASLSFPGFKWGGVVADQGTMEFSRGDATSGYYVGLGGQYISGYNVKDNFRIDGNGGAYWRVKTYPEYGNLSVGGNFFGMHYDNDQDAFTFGMGGYFSPQFYFLANVPVTWVGHYMTHLHYQIVGGLGIQAFQQDLTPLYPLAAQQSIEIALNNAALPALTSVAANYDFRGNLAYQIGPHWFAGGFLSANNTRNFNSASAGFSIHYMFRAQPSTVTAPTGIFPAEGVRPFAVP